MCVYVQKESTSERVVGVCYRERQRERQREREREREREWEREREESYKGLQTDGHESV